jgi:methyl-accepting chemotaxis protein
MLRGLRIGTRLAIGFCALIGGATLAFVAAVLAGRQGQAAINEIHQAAEQRIGVVRAMREAQLVLVSTIRGAGLQTDGAALNRDVDAYRATLKALVQREQEYSRFELGPEEQALLEQALKLRAQAEPMVDEAIRYAMAFAGDQAGKVLSEKFAPVEHEWALRLERLERFQAERARAAHLGIVRDNDRRLLMLSGLLAVVIAAGAAFAVAMTRSVTGPLAEAANAAARIAGGDLAVRIDVQGDDEAAQLLRSLQVMARQLATMVDAVREAAESIDAASREISQGNQDLSNRTELQAASVQQTSASLNELTGTVGRNSDNAHAVRHLAEQTAGVAGRGGDAMRQAAATMTRISEASRRIADIIGVIDGIAFQTNILALNAAVEAARAGEQGRGFAVVAGEVRSLARRASEAAAEVRALIGESVASVEDGARQIGGLEQTMQELGVGVERVRGLIGEISDASSNQNHSLSQVNQAVQAIDSSTQQNSALVEQVAAAAHSLSGQTERLTQLVHRFQVAAV